MYLSCGHSLLILLLVLWPHLFYRKNYNVVVNFSQIIKMTRKIVLKIFGLQQLPFFFKRNIISPCEFASCRLKQRQLDCLISILLRLTSSKTQKFHIIGPSWIYRFASQRTSNEETVCKSWRHHKLNKFYFSYLSPEIKTDWYSVNKVRSRHITVNFIKEK